jgi:DNA-binding NarL/FixJ family response regulator
VSPVLVGRGQHAAALDACLDRAQTGDGHVLLLSGEAGIGKTRLVGEAQTRALERGFQVLQGTCFETDRALPYAPFIDLLRGYLAADPTSDAVASIANRAALAALVPELREVVSNGDSAPRIDAESVKRETIHGFGALFRQLAALRPMLVIIEDVHWSDDTSAELLLHLARHCRSAPIAIVLTFRPDETPPALGGLLAGLNRERLASELRVQRLRRPDIGAMVEAIFRLDRPPRADFLDLLGNLSEGNPFLIEEILRSLVASGEIFFRDGRWDRKPLPELHVPHTIREAVEQRVARLSPSARRSVQFAAVVGRRFGFTFLQSLCAAEEPAILDSVKELLAAGLVVEESAETFAFRHALTREAVYAGLLARERQALHRQVAELIEGLHSDQPDALDDHLDLAYHFYEGTVWDKALDFGLRAGERALSLLAPRAAIEQLSRALEAANQLRIAPPVELRHARGQAFSMLDEFDAARDDFAAVLEAAGADGDDLLGWRVQLDMALLWHGRDIERGGVYVQQALEAAQRLNDPACIAESLNRLGDWHMSVQQPDAALESHRRALALFEELGDREAIAETLVLLGVTRQQAAEPVQAAAFFERAIPILRDLDDRPRLIDALVLRTVIGGAYTFDRVAPSLPLPLDAEAGLQLARTGGWRAGESFAAWELAMWHGPRGEYDRALELAATALDTAEEIEHRAWTCGARCALAAVHLDMLALDEALTHAEAALRLAHAIGLPGWRDMAIAFLVSIAVAERDLERALALVGDRPDVGLPSQTMGQRLLAYARSELLLARRKPDAALMVLESLASEAGSTLHQTPRREYLRGEALVALNRLEEAEAALVEARTGADAVGFRSISWRIEAALGRLYARQRRAAEADAAFATARGVITDLAERLPTERLRGTFTRQAARLLPAERQIPDKVIARERFGGLTGRERDVAALLARGLSNRAIASALVVGERTVETYVSNILNKLGYTSRAQVAAWAVDRGLATPD